MTELELLLSKRFAALSNPVDDSDWAAVTRRARPRSRSRWLLLAAALTLVGVLVATPALGLRGKLVRLFESAEPAPERVVEDFASLDIGAPPGMAPGVVAGSARKVMEVRVGPDAKAILWVAPTQSGGYCKQLELREEGRRSAGGSGGCDRNREIAVSPGLVIPGPISPQGEILRGPVLIDGTILLRPAASVRLVMDDGAQVSIPLVRVSEPIDAAFFVYSLPSRQWRPGHQPKVLIVLDGEGLELARDGKFFGLPLFGNPGLCANGPCEAVRSRKRRVIQLKTERGIPAAVWAAPAKGGGTCSWLTYGRSGFGGGCRPSPPPLDQFGLGISHGAGRGREVVLFSGEVNPTVASVLIRFQDGTSTRVDSVDGYILYEVGSVHYPRGRRPEMLVALDANGIEVARRRLSPGTAGLYPCSKPVEVEPGVSTCP